jgi:hypothetical protein
MSEGEAHSVDYILADRKLAQVDNAVCDGNRDCGWDCDGLTNHEKDDDLHPG